MPKFTATHGVNLANLGVTFTFDAEATGTSSTRVYTLDTDAATAKKLIALPAEVLAEYGIRPARPAE